MFNLSIYAFFYILKGWRFFSTRLLHILYYGNSQVQYDYYYKQYLTLLHCCQLHSYIFSLPFLFFSSFWLVTNSSGLFLFLGWSHIWLPFWTPTHFNSFSVDSLQSSMPIIMPVANTYNFCLFPSNFVLLFLFVTSS